VRAGNAVVINAAGRQANARVSFVSPVLDAHTKLVPVIAILDNRSAQWRVGEAVTASVQLADEGGSATITVPAAAIQTVEGKPVVFVRTKAGFQVVHVTLGDNAGRSVVVRSGLNGGEQIATTNSFTLKAEVGKGEAAHED
jgi:cobalt-zinc-cadmium efflux system membrane fusion protein